MNNKKLNSYYLYYKQVLKNKCYSEENLILEMKKRFGDSLKIRIGTWGRTTQQNSININIDDKSEYVIPLHSPEEILANTRRTLGQELEAFHWVIPPYIQMWIIGEMISTSFPDLEQLCRSTYNNGYFASQLTSTYQEIPLFVTNLSLIEESIECFILGKLAASITLLLTIIEGIARDFCELHNLQFNKHGSISAFDTAVKYGKSVWREKILLIGHQSKLILPEDYLNDEILRTVDEVMDMFISFERYGLNYLYKSQSNFTLNRHSILHGYNKDYYKPINFYRLYSCLEMLAVVVSYKFMPSDPNDLAKFTSKLQKFDLLERVSKMT